MYGKTDIKIRESVKQTFKEYVTQCVIKSGWNSPISTHWTVPKSCLLAGLRNEEMENEEHFKTAQDTAVHTVHVILGHQINAW